MGAQLVKEVAVENQRRCWRRYYNRYPFGSGTGPRRYEKRSCWRKPNGSEKVASKKRLMLLLSNSIKEFAKQIEGTDDIARVGDCFCRR